MSHLPDSTQDVDLARHAENRAKYPPEKLLKYAGHYIAWNAEGTQVVASGPDEYAIERELEIRGINPSQVVFSYVDALYEVIDEDICDSGSEARCGTNQSPPSENLPRSTQRPEPPDVSRYPENRAKHPPEELLEYVGQYLAWSPDGLQILASGSDEECVERQLIDRGIDPGQVVLEYIDAY